MSVRDVCDIAYVILLDRFTEDLRMRQLAARIALAMGGDAEIPDTEDEVAKFDAALLDDGPPEPVEPADIEYAELLAALGVPSRPWRR